MSEASEANSAEQSLSAVPISAQQAQRHVNFLLEMGLPVLWQTRRKAGEESVEEAQQYFAEPAAAERQSMEVADCAVALPTTQPRMPDAGQGAPTMLTGAVSSAAKHATKEANTQSAAASAWDDAEMQAPGGLTQVSNQVPNQMPSVKSANTTFVAAADSDGQATADAMAQQRAAAIANMDWLQLEQAVTKCHACALARNRTQAVFGVGDKRPQYLLVGEGPGRTEDALGEPFVGKSGKLLDSMLSSLDVARGKGVYIANIVKCRPTDASGNDRAPSPEEAASCRPFLQRQIALLQPELVLALGKTAAISLLAANPETAVSSLRGSVREISASYAGERQIPLVVSYHPAYLLRKPQDKARAWADLCLARSRLLSQSAQ